MQRNNLTLLGGTLIPSVILESGVYIPPNGQFVLEHGDAAL
jgi:hypothetical protein